MVCGKTEWWCGMIDFPVFDSEADYEGVVSLSSDGEESRQLQAPTPAWTPEARLSSPAGRASFESNQL